MTWSREPWALPRPAESPKGFPGGRQVRGGGAAEALADSTGRVSRLWELCRACAAQAVPGLSFRAHQFGRVEDRRGIRLSANPFPIPATSNRA